MNVLSAPLPRSVTLLFWPMFKLVVELENVPGPSSTYVPAGQPASVLLIVAKDAPAAKVEPHWVLAGGVQGLGVVSPSRKVAGKPDFDQSTARLEAIMPDQGVWA